jgi:phytoene synthase
MQESRAITQKSASNLALAFVLLPRAKRDGMSALYAFCREVDDVADDEARPVEDRRAALASWREDVRRACGTGTPRFPVNQELQAIAHKYHLPFEYFDEILRGVEMDLDIKRYNDYEQLETYCYRVASVVGLLSIEIFGYQDGSSKQYALHLGKALQFTNILRDVGSDADRGRIYLPLSELARFGVSPEQILRHEYSPAFFKLAESFADRARRFYTLARQSLSPVDRRSMIVADLMGSVYWVLLRKLERKRFDVLDPRPTKLNKGQKLLLILRAWTRFAFHSAAPAYGTP